MKNELYILITILLVISIGCDSENEISNRNYFIFQGDTISINSASYSIIDKSEFGDYKSVMFYFTSHGLYQGKTSTEYYGNGTLLEIPYYIALNDEEIKTGSFSSVNEEDIHIFGYLIPKAIAEKATIELGGENKLYLSFGDIEIDFISAKSDYIRLSFNTSALPFGGGTLHEVKGNYEGKLERVIPRKWN